MFHKSEASSNSHSPFDILKLPGKIVGKVVENVIEKPLHAVADAIVPEGNIHNAINLPGKVLHGVVDVIEKPIDKLVDAITPDEPTPLDILKVPTGILNKIVDKVVDKPLDAIGDAIDSNHDTVASEQEKDEHYVSTNALEFIPLLLVNIFFFIRNVLRTVFRLVFNIIFALISAIEGLLGFNGLVSEPLKNSVPIEIVWKSIQHLNYVKMDYHREGKAKRVSSLSKMHLNPLNMLSPVNLAETLNKSTMMIASVGNKLLDGPLGFVSKIPIIGGFTKRFNFLLKIQLFFQGLLDKLIWVYKKVKNFICWIFLTLKELLMYPIKSLKTAFQKG
ncbi:hypothetical protein FQA39_LY18023 [Lamprigera yunnana]|nr:hypothetical protein FQA39_LY18023 [Lamprigera yunnana]